MTTDNVHQDGPFTESLQSAYDKLLSSGMIAQQQNLRLINAFFMQSQQVEPYWQFGYFDDETENITTYVMKPEGIIAQKPDETMKEPESVIHSLDMEGVTIFEVEAHKIAMGVVTIEYNAIPVSVQIYLLQNDAELGPIWNITFITNTYEVVNVKIDVREGVVLRHKKHSLLDMQAQN